MAYVGSTAASTVANPPSRVSHGLLARSNVNESTAQGHGGSLWTYSSSNLTTDLATSNFFTDAKQLGMQMGDILMAVTYSTDSSTGLELVIGTIGGVSTSGASLSTNAGLISSTFA